MQYTNRRIKSGYDQIQRWEFTLATLATAQLVIGKSRWVLIYTIQITLAHKMRISVDLECSVHNPYTCKMLLMMIIILIEGECVLRIFQPNL